jgi:carboxypeptidase PM20D1
MKRIIVVLLVAFVALFAVLVVRAVLDVPADDVRVERVAVAAGFAEAEARLAGAIRFPTISKQDTSLVDTTAFLSLHAYLRDAYPGVLGTLHVERMSGLSLLLTWEGSSPDRAPVLLMGHLDVVSPGADSLWAHPPFGGERSDGFVWGRGTLDNKIGVVASLEAVERLISEGYQPERTFYFAFGHDEEVGGSRGAAVIADTLAARLDGKLSFVLDEGGFVGKGLLDGLDVPVALVGIAEKGYLTLELSALAPGGHSSAPPEVTAVGRVSRAVARLESEPFPARVDGATRAMFKHVRPYMGVTRRVIFSNLWLLEPLVRSLMAADAGAAALVRTTTAATMIGGGVKENVLPTKATAIINFRILPGETTDTVTERVRRVIDDPDVGIAPVNVYFDPSPVSDPAAPAFALVRRTVRETIELEDLVVTPFLVPGATDSRYFTGLADNVYRFLPVVVGREELETIHSAGERISAENVRACAAFLYQLIRNTDQLEDGPADE